MSTPPLPAGYALDSKQQSAPPLPPGYALDSSAQIPDAVAQSAAQTRGVVQGVAQNMQPSIFGGAHPSTAEEATINTARPQIPGMVSNIRQAALASAGGELGSALAETRMGTKLPWLARTMAGASGAGAGAGAGTLISGGSPKEVLGNAAGYTATAAPLTGLAEGVPALQSAVSKIVRDPATGKVRSPWEIAIDKVIPDPYAPGTVPAKLIPKGTNYGQYLQGQTEAYKENQRLVTQAAKAARTAPKPAPVPFAEAQSAEGVPGTLPKPSGRLIKLPQEFAAEDQLQGIAKTRASQRGMQFAAGMVPGEGRSVPRTSTATNTVEFPSRPVPWETQGATAPAAASVATPQFKGGINQKGVEASNVQMSPEDTMTSLSTEIGRMNTRLRNSAGSSTAERIALQNQINEYQQRLDELRGPAQRLPWAKR